ncbi:tail fiber protein [Rhodococcus phage ReqiPepy6]|uniref:Tail fiber protein n=1 Tax=Rhodococcus phage ReqiPepy6 TaxID=691965 RepID=D4P7B6_9CAUD|nr:tail fiber protein [Rhodococcus phage ReqiPepy6]ADD80896.1 tail fiber protein [Rhodococcus phage ReqiPepy6]
MPTIKNRRAPASQWAASNPVLASGEIGIELDTNKFKVGNGVNAWGTLPYFVDELAIRALAPTSFMDNRDKALLVGSSTMAGMGTRLQAALTSRGVEGTFNRTAVGSWQASHISAAVGTRPLVAETFVIPASGPVTVKPINQTEGNNTVAGVTFPGWFGDVIGMLSSPANQSEWTFTRDAPGQEVTIPEGTPFRPSVPSGRRRGLVLLNFGKNSLTTTVTGWDVAQLIAQTETIDSYFGGPDGRVLVIGHFVNTTTPASSTTRDKTKAYNDYCRQKFGDRFFDLGAYLTGTQVWADTGITPTSEDTAEQALGNKPPSLSGDNGHLNASGYDAAVKAIMARVDALKWTPPPPPPSWVVKATDDFNASDGLLTGRVLPTGGLTWKTLGSGTSLSIVGNRVATTSGVQKSVVSTGSVDGRVSFTITSLGSDPATKSARLLVRAKDQSTYYFAAPRVSNVSDGLSIWKNVAGTQTALKSHTSYVPVVGDEMEFEVDGSTLRLFVNGVERLVATDNELTTGDFGLELGSTQTTFDNFKVSTKAA